MRFDRPEAEVPAIARVRSEEETFRRASVESVDERIEALAGVHDEMLPRFLFHVRKLGKRLKDSGVFLADLTCSLSVHDLKLVQKSLKQLLGQKCPMDYGP